MSKKAEIFKGAEVKELLEKAVGGIYFSHDKYRNILTDYTENYIVAKDNLQIGYITLPICLDKDYINYAVPGEEVYGEVWGEITGTEWFGNEYFDYVFGFGLFYIAFNIKSKDPEGEITFEEFKSLISDVCPSCAKEDIFNVKSVDFDLLGISLERCSISFYRDGIVHEDEINILSGSTRITIDKNIIERIVNYTEKESYKICYSIEFNNGMPDVDITINPEYEFFR